MNSQVQPSDSLMIYPNRSLLIMSVCLLLIGCDQWTKSLAFEYLSRGVMDSYLWDMLRLGYVENLGAFLGLGKQLPEVYRFYILTFVVSLFLLALLVYMLFNRALNHCSLLALSMIFAGGCSNLFDRATNSGAVDFINLGLGPVRTGVFNLADMAIFWLYSVCFIAAGLSYYLKQFTNSNLGCFYDT